MCRPTLGSPQMLRAVGSAAVVLSMGSSRRKGSGRTAAAAAQQQWKVGDLVLAKMRGFPAWPAMVSEPEKWGFSAVRKKLFVYFYGTKQIAFCNYADIEAFTEEKKKSLLLKCHGKGADFVRAVDEIIDIYETLKKQNLDEFSSGDDEVKSNAEDLEFVGTRSDSSGFRNSSELGLHTDANHKLESAWVTIETNNRMGSQEVSATSTADESQKNLIIDEPIQMLTILNQPRQNSSATNITSTKKRLSDASQHNSILQKKVPSLRTSRSSLISKTQVSASVCDYDISSDLISDVIHSENTDRRSKQNMPYTLNFHLMDIPCTASMPLNGCREEVSAKIAEKDHEASTDEDRVKQNLELPTNKKKRKLNRKQVNDASECVVLNKDDDLQVVLSSIRPSPSSEEKEVVHKTDGDEYLPLVKRARVRMGKPVTEVAQCGGIVCGDEKLETSLTVNNCDGHHTSPTAGNNIFLNEKSLTARKDLNSSSHNCSPLLGETFMFWEAKYKLKGCILDVESALPPSKRLHRALEAMSANATEAADTCAESPRVIDTNVPMDSSKMNFLHLSNDTKSESPVRLQSIHSSCNNTNAISQLGSPLQNLDIPSLSCSEVKTDDILTEIVRSPKNKDCNKILKDVDECNGLSISKAILGTAQNGSQPSSSKFSSSTAEDMGDKVCSLLDKSNNSIIGDKDESHHVCVDHTGRDGTVEPIKHHKQNALSKAEGGVHSESPDEGVLSVSAADMFSVASSTSGATMSSFQSDEDSQTCDMQGAEKEAQHRQTSDARCISSDLTPMKGLIAAAHAKQLLSHSISFSHNYLDGKFVPDALISPSIVHKGDSSGQGSAPNSLVNHTCTIDYKNGVLQKDGRSPHIGLQLKGINRSNHAEASAAWKTFQALLCTLSRTKENIGRATRLAIDCGKYGMAGEVIEILLQNLEREQNLHRRVDLFFLVDSITQCSRNHKVGAGDAYPYLVQSVLPRLLSAAAPHGNAASENRRQCLKVLRLWLKRKTLPESIVRHHMQELDSTCELSYSSGSSRCPSRTERAINDPLREMEGILVDEYGSNTNFQLPRLLHTNVLEDEGNAFDDKSFEAVTPERCTKIDREIGATQPSTEKNRHVLEDVDVEFEMEDVSPPSEVNMNSTCHVAGTETINSHHQIDRHSLPFAPPLPEDRPPSPPPLPSSPPFISSCSIAHAVVPQWRSGLDALSDTADLQVPETVPNLQNLQSNSFRQRPANQNACLMSRKPAPYYGLSYGCLPGQMPPPPVSYVNISASHPSIHSRNDFQSLASTSLTDTGYHLQPPPPIVSNQFSYVQAEPQQRAQPWGNCSISERYQYLHDSHRVNFHGDQGTRGLVHNEIVAENMQPGPSVNKIDASPASLPPYGCQPEPSFMRCNGWSLPPRMSNYSILASRPSVEGTTPTMTGASDYWRPR
ncbi:unnamed protein product [Musa hybrid cultivar]